MVLHGTYHSAGVARTFHQFPLVPLESSFEYALERVRIAFSKHGIKAVIVCDGLSNPLKKEEDDRRGRERDESLAQLRTLYTTTANPTADDLATALKLSKDSCRTTSRVIAQLKSWADLHPSSVIVVGSFSEADQQLASMCMDVNAKVKDQLSFPPGKLSIFHNRICSRIFYPKIRTSY